VKHLTFPENKLNFPHNVLLQVTKTIVGKKKKQLKKTLTDFSLAT